MHWTFAINFFVALLAIVNPLSKIPVWFQAADFEQRKVRWTLALLIIATGTAILLIFLLGGQPMLDAFGIDLPSFRIGGGIVILIVGINMLYGRLIFIDPETQDKEGSAYQQAKVRFREVVVPLSIPMIAGPGSISTVIIYGSNAQTWLDQAMLVVGLGVVMFITLLTLLFAHPIYQMLGETIPRVLTRVYGLILAAVAAQLITEGLSEVFPAWTHVAG
ncbi:MAG: MarC family protein [Phycisphaerae bacterium]|nr:MarC family protein [Phycisphaerae bacterium]